LMSCAATAPGFGKTLETPVGVTMAIDRSLNATITLPLRSGAIAWMPVVAVGTAVTNGSERKEIVRVCGVSMHLKIEERERARERERERESTVGVIHIKNAKLVASVVAQVEEPISSSELSDRRVVSNQASWKVQQHIDLADGVALGSAHQGLHDSLSTY